MKSYEIIYTGDRMKFTTLIILGLITLSLVGCATPMKAIKKTHAGDLKSTFSKYKAVFNQHEWEINQSDADGGFLKAIKAQTSLGVVTGISSATVSCSSDGSVSCFVKLDRCNNTVPLSGCSPMSEYTAKNELQDFLNDLEKIK